MTFSFLGAFVAIAVWSMLKDRRDMAKLKAAANTAARQRIMIRWMVESWVAFGLVAVAGLALTGNWARLVEPVLRLPGLGRDTFDTGSLAAGIAVGLVILIAGQVIAARRKARRITPAEFEKMKQRYLLAGDVAALIPRNAAERRVGAGLSLAAGVSEELMFRALLPALIFDACGGRFAWWAVGVSVVLFGLMHAYQGIGGVIGTAFAGAVFMAVYLVSGNIFGSMLLHFLVDLRSMVLTSWVFETAEKTISRIQAGADATNQSHP
jgi:membrane protease YdiL (CAAX protease family)